MNYSTAIFLINNTARALMCTYEACDNAPRQMFKTMDPSIKVDDYVLVQTNTRHLMTVCKVVEADVDVNFHASDQITWIIQKVEKEPLEKLMAQEAEAITMIKSAEKRKIREELRTALLADNEGLKTLAIASDVDNAAITGK